MVRRAPRAVCKLTVDHLGRATVHVCVQRGFGDPRPFCSFEPLFLFVDMLLCLRSIFWNVSFDRSSALSLSLLSYMYVAASYPLQGGPTASDSAERSYSTLVY